MPHHLDRFQSAVMTLAGNGDVKQRLMRAYSENLESLSDGDLPGELARDFSALRSRLTSVQPFNNESAICASIRKMSAMEASDCAISVVSMYGRMLRRSPSDQLAESTEIQSGVPPFLVKSAS